MKKSKYYKKNANYTKRVVQGLKQLTQRKKLIKNVYIEVPLNWKCKLFNM